MPEPAAAGRRDWGLWVGRALSGLVVLFLLLDGAMKLVPIAPVADMAGQLGPAEHGSSDRRPVGRVKCIEPQRCRPQRIGLLDDELPPLVEPRR